MGEVVKFTKPVSEDTNEYGFISGVRVIKPKTSYEYLALCKRFLTDEDYSEVCVCILDKEEYEKTEPQIKNIVKCFYSFNS